MKHVSRMTTAELEAALEAIEAEEPATEAAEERLLSRAEAIEAELHAREDQAAANRGEMNGVAPDF